jgi:hypothetical protein
LITHVDTPSIARILDQGARMKAPNLPSSAVIGWGLAVAAPAVGYAAYGWPGVFLAISAVAFWLLLQFSRALRAMRLAAGRPIGRVDNAVMFHSRLTVGLRLVDIFKLTRSLGQRTSAADQEPEFFVWEDNGGDRVHVELNAGRVTTWRLERAEAPAA